MSLFKNILVLSISSITLLSLATESVTLHTEKYTLDEIAKHNTEKSCWMQINNGVYDVTKYLKEHPAPYKVLLKHCGKDATKDFETMGGIGEKHSKKALNALALFNIGMIKT
jgi:cytochrome b involved in lipid metabolism